MIPVPHGGRLIDLQVPAARAERRYEELRDLPKLWPEFDQIYDAEKIATGAYSPLTGFMDQATLESVLLYSRLPSSLPWTIPILLTPPGSRNRHVLQSLTQGDEVALMDGQNRFIAVLRVHEKFAPDKASIARLTYRTTDLAHPNVADLARTGDVAIAGPLQLISRPNQLTLNYELTPAEMRATFARRHWNHVAGYQTRNVPHRAHEQLQRMALEREEIDGLLIHPVVGRLKPGDYRPEIVLAAYERLVGNYYPADRVLLASLTIAMRYAGPRAALFLAIVRKNFGCSHYIVGRDQAGVGSYYGPYESQRIFDDIPVGIVPLRFQESFYCRRCEGIASSKTCAHPASEHELTSQTRIRAAILHGEPLPRSLLRPEVATILMRGREVLNLGSTAEEVREFESAVEARAASIGPPAAGPRPAPS